MTLTKPNPGSVITVTVRDVLAPRHIPPGPDHRVYQGEVVRSDRWLTDREFSMTGDLAWPVRIINLGNVIDIQFESGTSTAVDTAAQTWEVTGTGGARYLVTRDSAGWSCDCKGFQFRRNCRHVTELNSQA